jgi:hypothetical protein
MEEQNMAEDSQCTLTEKFNLWEKLFAQLSFFTMGIAATVGIIMADWIWVIPYIIVYWYGVPGIVMKHLTCPRCPHYFEYNDCLQLPLFFTRILVKRQKQFPFSTFEKVLFHFIFIFIPIYPLYWLLPNTLLLSIFIICAVAWYSGQFFYFCKRCRNKECPYNLAPIKF